MELLAFKALADETRLRLIHILMRYELSVNELVQILDMGQSRVSRHLKILSEAGLLNSRRDGLWVFYSAPVSGEKSDFLNTIQSFFPNDCAMDADLTMGAQILEERARRTRQFFNAIADNWDELNHEVLGDFDLPGRILSAVPDDCSVAVDLGCGTGLVLKSILSRARVAIGVDGSARMLELCRARIGVNDLASGRASLRIGELSHLPMADHEAEFASINLVLHHLARPEEIFTELRRIIAPGGILLITDFLKHKEENMRLHYGDHWLGFDPADIEKHVRAADFGILSRETHPVGKGLSVFIIKAQAMGDTLARRSD